MAIVNDQLVSLYPLNCGRSFYAIYHFRVSNTPNYLGSFHLIFKSPGLSDLNINFWEDTTITIQAPYRARCIRYTKVISVSVHTTRTKKYSLVLSKTDGSLFTNSEENIDGFEDDIQNFTISPNGYVVTPDKDRNIYVDQFSILGGFGAILYFEIIF